MQSFPTRSLRKTGQLQQGAFVALAICLAVVMWARPVSAGPIGTGKVFAHNMLNKQRPHGYGVAAYKDEIHEAIAQGYDGFALNINRDKNLTVTKERIDDMFDAVRELTTDEGISFKLYLKFDDAPGWPIDTVRDWIWEYAFWAKFKPYYFYVWDSDGVNKPVVSTWGAAAFDGDLDTPADWKNNVIDWLQTNKSAKILFAPTAGPGDGDTPQDAMNDWLDNQNWGLCTRAWGYFGTAAAPARTTDNWPGVYQENWSKSLLESGEGFAQSCRDHGIKYFCGVSPHYWLVYHKNNDWWEYKGPIGLKNQWESVLTTQRPDWMETTTWNDFGEGTYYSTDGTYDYDNDVHVVIRELDHSGFAQLNKYYIQWYKNDAQPAITDYRLFVGYRIHQALPEDQLPAGLPHSTTGYVYFHGDALPASRVHVVAMIPPSAPACQLKVYVGGSLVSTSGTLSPGIVTYSSGVYNLYQGQVRVELRSTSNNALLEQFIGAEDIVPRALFSGPDKYGNYHYYCGATN